MPISFAPQNGASGSTSPPEHSGATATTDTTGTTGPIAAAAAITLGQLGHLSIKDFRRRCPAALLQAMLTDSRTKVLNSPQVRASDGQKGDAEDRQTHPYATGSFQPGVGTVGVSPLVSTQFNYADVGVNIDHDAAGAFGRTKSRCTSK